MGARPTKLEEGKLKKPVVMEEEEEEKRENWNENDKADYEMNKKFEKLIVEIVAMKEKMENMQLDFRKAQWINDCLYNVGNWGSKPLFLCLPSSRFLTWKSLMVLGS